MIDDMTLERDLRALLASRDPGPAPASLAGTVRARIQADRGASRLPVWVRSAVSLAAVAGVAAMIVLGLVVTRPGVDGPGASAPPATSTPYRLATGDGVVSVGYPVVQTLAGIMTLALLLLTALGTTNRRTRIAASVGCLMIAFVALTIGTSNALAFTGGGYGLSPTRATSGDETGMVVAVTGDSPFTLVLTVSNDSRLPLTLVGVPEAGNVTIGSGSEPATLPQFVAIANLPQDAFLAEAAERFVPVTIAPGASVNVAILGMAGRCAIPTPDPRGDASYSIQHVTLVYEQLTIAHTQPFALPEPIKISTSTACPDPSGLE